MLSDQALISRRAVLAGGLGLLLGGCSSPEPQQPKLTEEEFKQVVTGPLRWERLPDVSRAITDMACFKDLPELCYGAAAENMTIDVNTDMLRYVGRKLSLEKLQLTSRLGFIEDWGQNSLPEKATQGLVATFAGFSPDNKEQVVLSWLKVFSLITFRDLESRNWPIAQFGPEVSYLVSHSLVSGLARLYEKPLTNGLDPKIEQQKTALGRDMEIQYMQLYEKFGGQGYGQEGLLFSIIPTIPEQSLRDTIYADARRLGI